MISVVDLAAVVLVSVAISVLVARCYVNWRLDPLEPQRTAPVYHCEPCDESFATWGEARQHAEGHHDLLPGQADAIIEEV